MTYMLFIGMERVKSSFFAKHINKYIWICGLYQPKESCIFTFETSILDTKKFLIRNGLILKLGKSKKLLLARFLIKVFFVLLLFACIYSNVVVVERIFIIFCKVSLGELKKQQFADFL